MKKYLWILFALILMAGTSCQERIDIEKEKEAIKAVILEESNAFNDRDFNRLAATYIQDETNIRMGASKSGYGYRVGWEDIGSAIKEYIEQNPDQVTRKVQLTDYKIKVYNGSAWIVFTDDEGNIGARFLERIDGEWKIVFLNAINTTSYEVEVEEGEVEPETEENE